MLNPPPPPGAERRSTSRSGERRRTRTGSPTGASARPRPESTEMTGSVWPHVEEAIVDRVVRHRSTIVFCNSRRLAERLTGRLNEIYSERLGLESARRAVPAAMMAQAGATAGADPVLAKAHHGSVSKEQRAQVEEELKSGILRCVVATSSLELGIDMGAVDLVIQVEAPPSAASGLQRIGRAGHQVGEVSRAALFPKHRGDVLHTAIVTERMLAGQIEAISSRRIRSTSWRSRRWRRARSVRSTSKAGSRRSSAARRSARSPGRPTRRRSTCSPAAFPPTSSPSCGRAWSGTATTARSPVAPAPSGSRSPAAAPSPTGGCSASSSPGESQNARVGELDEEMVYESRVNDVFTLGTTSWRIVEITHDRVNVLPAFGQPGKVPFWHGDGIGRPAELGEALGKFSREVSTATARRPKSACGMPAWTTTRPATCSPTWASSARRRARCRPTAPSRWSAPATRWATGASSFIPLTACRCTRRGRSPSTPGSASGWASRGPPSRATTASSRGFRMPRPSLRAPSCSSSSPKSWSRSSPTRSADPRSSRRGSASARRGRCSCRVATPDGGARCGSSGSDPRSCSRWPAATDLPDHPRDAARSAAGRLRRPALLRITRAIGERRIRLVETTTRSRRRSRATCSSGTSAPSCTRATRRSPNGVRRRSRSIPRCCRSCSARSRCGSCSTPT